MKVHIWGWWTFTHHFPGRTGMTRCGLPAHPGHPWDANKFEVVEVLDRVTCKNCLNVADYRGLV